MRSMDEPGGKIFLDTNILIYAYSETEAEKKAKVLPLLEDEPVSLSTQVVNEFVWVMNKKFNVPMDSLRHIVKNLFGLYHVGIVTDATITKAMDMSSQLNFPYWDSLIVASALETGCDILFTEDLQHGQVIENRLTVRNPFK
jgi:predicted nucleic acid-binding protein